MLTAIGGYSVRVDDELERSWLIDKFGTESTSLAIQLIPGIQVQAVVRPLNEENPIIIEIDSQQIVDQKLKQQEQWIETNLQKYVEAKENEVIQTKEQQLALIGQKVRPSSALYFDGVNDYINAWINPSLEVSNTLTIEAWINPQKQNQVEGGIIVNREGEYEIAVWNDGTIRWAFANSNPGWNWINTGYTISTDKWTHIAVSYDQGLIKTYANGSLVHTYDGTGAIGDVVASQNEFRIGYRQAANSQYFKGEIDEVRVWNVAKTQSQIQANLNQKLSGKEQGLVGYWNFEEATGNTVNDLTTNKNNGTLINGVQRTVANSNPITRPEGKTLYFDGVNDYINAGTNPSLELSTNLTLEAWINPQQDSRHRGIVGREGEYLLALSGADNIIYYALGNISKTAER